ncbi:MAG: CHASE4 domain-containing protein [Negativicutes bacterium]|jgi:sensor domain CHASE-containing protein
MKRTFLVWMALIVFFVMIAATVSVVLIMNHYAYNLEMVALKQEMTYIGSAIDEKQKELLVRAQDWSIWDESYNYMNRPNSEFVNSNLDTNMFRTNKINFIVYLRNDGQVIFSRGYDYAANKDISIPSELASMLSPRSIKAYAGAGGTLNGIIKSSGGSMIIAVSPIMKATGPSDSPGWLIFASYISGSFIGDLSALKYVKMEPVDVSFTELAQTASKDISLKVGSSELIVPPTDRGAVEGYLLIKDIYNNPIMGAKLIFEKNLREYINMLRDRVVLVLVVFALVLPICVLLYMNKVLGWYIGQ